VHLDLAEAGGGHLRLQHIRVLKRADVGLADQIIVEHGTAPVDELFHALRGQSLNDGVTDLDALLSGRAQPRNGTGFELYRIGDAVSSRTIPAAVLDAYRLCCPM